MATPIDPPAQFVSDPEMKKVQTNDGSAGGGEEPRRATMISSSMPAHLWQYFPEHLLEHKVLGKLSVIDQVRMSGVCSSWKRAIKSPGVPFVVSSSTQHLATTSRKRDHGALPWFFCGGSDQLLSSTGRLLEWPAFDPNTNTWRLLNPPATCMIEELMSAERGIMRIGRPAKVEPVSGKGGLVCWLVRKSNPMSPAALLLSKPFAGPSISRLLRDVFPPEEFPGILRLARLVDMRPGEPAGGAGAAPKGQQLHLQLVLIRIRYSMHGGHGLEVFVEKYDLCGDTSRPVQLLTLPNIQSARWPLIVPYSFYYVRPHDQCPYTRLAFFPFFLNWHPVIQFFDGGASAWRLIPLPDLGALPELDLRHRDLRAPVTDDALVSRFHMVQLDEHLLLVALVGLKPPPPRRPRSTAAPCNLQPTPSSHLLVFNLLFPSFQWKLLQGSTLDLDLPTLPTKSDCIASCSQLLFKADNTMYLYDYSTAQWRKIPPCVSAAGSTTTISTLGCAFDPTLGGDLHPT